MGFFMCSLFLLNSCVAIALTVKQFVEGNVYLHTYLFLVVGILITCAMTVMLDTEFVLYKLKQANIVDENWESVIGKE